MQFRPVTSITNLYGWPVDRMEIDIVFAHELVETDVLWVEPPLFPLGGVVRSYTGVPDGRIEL